MKAPILAAALLLCVSICFSQEYFGGKFRRMEYTMNKGGEKYTLYDFSREGQKIKAKYFATNAYSQYQAWKTGKQILLIAPGAFSDSYDVGAKPIGLCVDNGTIVNKDPDKIMDGMVIVYNGGEQKGGIAVVDLDIENVRVDGTTDYDPRASDTDKVKFLNWGRVNGLTLFQAQLLYSAKRSQNFTNLNYGSKRERRFLAICMKDGFVHHVVVDAPDDLELNLSASYAKIVLETAGLAVKHILNLDTGDKNLLYAYNGSSLVELNVYEGLPENKSRAKIENATNLLIYYIE